MIIVNSLSLDFGQDFRVAVPAVGHIVTLLDYPLMRVRIVSHLDHVCVRALHGGFCGDGLST